MGPSDVDCPSTAQGLVLLIPLCQGMSWAGTSVVRPCWNPMGLGMQGGRDMRKGSAEISVVWRGQEMVALLRTCVMGRDGEEGAAEETGGRAGALGSLECKAGHSA